MNKKTRRQVEIEFNYMKESLDCMAWHGFLNKEMFLLNASELRAHLDKIVELYQSL